MHWSESARICESSGATSIVVAIALPTDVCSAMRRADAARCSAGVVDLLALNAAARDPAWALEDHAVSRCAQVRGVDSSEGACGRNERKRFPCVCPADFRSEADS